MDNEKALKQFGLSQKQAKTYLAALELGSAPVNKIAKKAGLARSSSYDILEELVKMGVASQIIKKKVKYFSVEDPKKIVSLARQKAEVLESVLPQLNAVYGLARQRPQARFFQGLDGMKQIFEEIIADKKDITAFGSVDDLFAAMGDYHLKFVERRVKRNISVKTILRESEKSKERQAVGSRELRIAKTIPDGQFKYHGMIMMFGNKIAYFSFVEDYIAVVIDSKELTDMQRALFEYLWERIE